MRNGFYLRGEARWAPAGGLRKEVHIDQALHPHFVETTEGRHNYSLIEPSVAQAKMPGPFPGTRQGTNPRFDVTLRVQLS